MRLQHRVTIQQPVETQDAYGEPTVRWQTVEAGVWAGIVPLRGREYFAAKQMQSEVEARILMRYRPDLTAKMKIVHDQTCVCKVSTVDEYLVEGIINVGERNREMHLMCKRFVE